MVFANTGNMGLPLCLFAFGDPGLELAAVFFTVSMVMMLLFGAWLMATPKKVLGTPLPYALAAALRFAAPGSSRRPGSTTPPACSAT